MTDFEDLARDLGIDLDDPEEQLARDLAEADDNLLEDLVALRHRRGLKQQDIADAIGRHKSSVSNFERLGADPHMSTIRRYAAAVGARVRHIVEPVDGLEHTCDGTNFTEHVESELRPSEPTSRWQRDAIASLVVKSGELLSLGSGAFVPIGAGTPKSSWQKVEGVKIRIQSKPRSQSAHAAGVS
ncbi:helix-turn-helix transcriptional regulator [Rhodococcus sp. JVH1]|uniref:helix-turn-helix domain-containing protein n=1 Tax=Rhodococcus sp. JVH1 TaxID=745408 RepID=UPI0006852657|nr:helix-turn-helix transcriptional regulator [Rhodococcus sp. JVH1]